VFFKARDALAFGAIEGEFNLYEWHDGQITLLSADIPGAKFPTELAGATADGDSVFFRTKRQLVAQDLDERQDVYVARVGGGFAPPAPPMAPCNPLVEGACQGPASAGLGVALAPASAAFSGAGNEAGPKPRKKKGNKKKGKKSGHGTKKKSGKKQKGRQARDTTTNGRAAK
jgi:hypothetical protein